MLKLYLTINSLKIENKMVDVIVKIGGFLFGSRWNSMLAVWVNFYLSNKFKQGYKSLHSESYNNEITHKMLIYMADGKMRHGGISDRLRGAVSVYKLCKNNGFVFKIHFVHPFDLSEFLIPNTYNWLLLSDEIIYDKRYSMPIVRSTGLPKQMGKKQEKRMLAKVMDDKMQYHIYTNNCFAEDEFHDLFVELFKPSFKLQSLIDENLKKINGDYISISFRFQQALGDFRDSPSKILKEEDALMLIKKCLDACSYIHKIAPSHKKVLITSDSIRFINAVKCFSYVYIVPGDVGHLDYNSGTNANMKTFLDLFLISRAQKAYNVVSKEMYNGGFALRGAMIGGIEYEIVRI